MSKEELIKLLKELKIAEINSFKIVYYSEERYGMIETRQTTTLTINEKGE